MRRYNPQEIEPKWQKIWEETGVYTADLGSAKPKYIAMSMFNYPSGAGIHIGHAMNYTISDVKARFKRQQGYESYHPIGWDAFGLPAENYAIKSGVSPQESMANIIPMYHKQYKAMGWSNDWQKEISTHLPQYYKWSQWIFSQMYKHGLAYQDSRLQWWCPIDNTVLANEQVIDGKCWRHDGPDDPPAEKREVKQWFFKITDYADELLAATETLDWTDSVKVAQKNWIGRSEGTEIDFTVEQPDSQGPSSEMQWITVFTTRPDTLFGATFLVVAPEHPWANALASKSKEKKVSDYIYNAINKSEMERLESKEKSGVFTGSYAINPLTKEKIEIWVADYVLGGYGTGAIMAVPAHDERDWDFAKKYKLPIRQVVAPYEIFSGEQAPREEVETTTRQSVDAIIADGEGNYLLQKEGDQVHFVGGGIEEEAEEDAVRREVIEETGFKNIAAIRRVTPFVAGIAYRHTKNKNQRGWGAFYEVVLNSKDQASSEIDQGKHTVEWVKKEKVHELLTWSWHRDAWEYYLANRQDSPYPGEGLIINSDKYNGILSEEVRKKITGDINEMNVGAERILAREKIQYKMRDWSVSRQRYWGAPIPIIHCPKCGPQLVPDAQLPVTLPELSDFAPSGDGRSALARAKDWLIVDCPNCGGRGERETDTLDTYIDSSWYMYRYFDPHNQEKIFDSALVNKWQPIDFYNGADHATAHLLYARFIGHFFKKIGLIEQPEPFKQFLFNGKVTAADGTMFSKSKGNGVDPLEIIDSGYGADALRTYLMFAAPLELWVKWDYNGVPGTHRFLSRLWNITQEYLESETVEIDAASANKILKAANKMIDKTTADLEKNHYNTAIAAMMGYINQLYKFKEENFGRNQVWQQALEAATACVAPFAPHIAEELWQQLGHSSSIHKDSWPAVDKKYLVEEKITLAVQINGKVRAEIVVDKDAGEEDVLATARAEEKIAALIKDKKITKEVYVPGRIVSLVVSD